MPENKLASSHRFLMILFVMILTMPVAIASKSTTSTKTTTQTPGKICPPETPNDYPAEEMCQKCCCMKSKYKDCDTECKQMREAKADINGTPVEVYKDLVGLKDANNSMCTKLCKIPKQNTNTHKHKH
ncbi:MAG: hypothetical protein KGJ89_00370 [Patescibacteria group bacterium]|nr:hypothetical protein [Patescibacteria group bacterium]MDE2014975.1 hypothetical protein [Patescibacteria group bacterium]MDE2226404.1 hypothetical protein [Patescibacteria group bacterium]